MKKQKMNTGRRTLLKGGAALLAMAMGCSLLALPAGCSPKATNEYEYTRNNLYAYDALGREITPVSGLNGKKSVGIYYMLWEGQHGITAKPYDISKLLEENPAALWDVRGNDDSPLNALHWWGEPLYGYYNMQDEWVVRRHMEMLTCAGIDYLGFDVTNIETYDEVWLVICTVLQEMAEDGIDIPKIVFYTHTTDSGTSWNKVVHFYDVLYAQNRFRDVWYQPNGKPVIITVKAELERNRPDLMQFFDVRSSQWPGAAPQDKGVPWMSFQRPQEIVGSAASVSVAQQLQRFSEAYPHELNGGYRENASWGRGYTSENGFDHSSEAVLRGDNFQEEWDFVIDNPKVDQVFVTSWNEWVAQKFVSSGANGSYVSFTDCFNMEYSRDVEPMKGGYGDNYLMQLTSNVRAFKEGTAPKKANVNKKTVTLGKSDDWRGIPFYRDPRGDAAARNHVGSWNYIYRDDTNRNDIISVAIANDDTYLYLNATVAFELIRSDDANWMNVYFNVVDDAEKGVGGFNYVLNRSRDLSASKATLSRLHADGTLSDVGACDLFVRENGVEFRIPLSLLSLSASKPKVAVKVTDNIQNFTDPMDFYVSGDSAPIGRYAYGYGM